MIPLPDDIQDLKAMCVKKFNGAAVQIPEAILAAIPHAPPAGRDFVTPTLKEGTYGIPADIFAAMPQMTWDGMYQTAGR